IYQVLCGLAALMLVALVMGTLFWPVARLEGRLPDKTVAGQPVTGSITVTNRSWRPIYDLQLVLAGLPSTVAEPTRHQTVGWIPGGESASAPITLVPARRGVYELPDLRAYTSFPFNLFLIGASRQPMGSLMVLPAFHRLASIELPLSQRYQPGGIALTSHVGESPEYIGNREYVPGEPARRLDFRSWARLGAPVVREFQEEYYCRIALVLDTYVPVQRRWWGWRGPDGTAWVGTNEKPIRERTVPQLEAAISLAAAVADVLSRGEHLIDLFAAGPELYVFRAGRHTAHLENVLEILACIDACWTDPFQTVAPALAEELGNISAAVCVFLDWDASRSRLAQAIVEAGCRLKIVIVRDGPTSEPLDAHEFGDCLELSVAQVREGRIESL
ncbi:MAG TPA: DUF58 domain-containing protein, partial [Planctomycetaceae bacterium]|nr:DUF58 domain-containing protein [Planctomycetaceae bacterium]